MAHMLRALPLVVAGLAVVAPRLASACHEAKVCLKWPVKFIDNNVGEDFPGPGVKTIPARGVRFVHIPPPPEQPREGFADDDGCVTINTQYEEGHKLVAYAQADVGTVLIFGSYEGADGGAVINNYTWIGDVEGLVAGDEAEWTIGGDDLWNPFPLLMAAATATIDRFEGLGLLPAEQLTLELRFQPWNANARASCLRDADGPGDDRGRVIEVGADAFYEKFAVAHEIAHWLQCNGNGLLGLATEDYEYEVTDDDCAFGAISNPPSDSNLHGIRSAENSSVGYTEGFAHFMASVAFNRIDQDDAIFRYYKHIDLALYPAYSEFVAKNSLVSLKGGTADTTLGGKNAWVENMCMSDFAQDEVSSGLDWMRFFWHFLKAPGTAPTVQEIVEFLNYADETQSIDEINVYAKLKAAMADGGSGMSTFTTRFEAANSAMGVSNDP